MYEAYSDYSGPPSDDAHTPPANQVEEEEQNRGYVHDYPLAALWRRYLALGIDIFVVFFIPAKLEDLTDDPYFSLQFTILFGLATLAANYFLGTSAGHLVAGTQIAYPMMDPDQNLWFCRPPLKVAIKRVAVWPLYMVLQYIPLVVMPALSRKRQTPGDWWVGVVTIDNYFPKYSLSPFGPAQCPDGLQRFWTRHKKQLASPSKSWIPAPG